MMVLETIEKEQVLTFRTAEELGVERLASYYARCDFGICEYSLGIKVMMQKVYGYTFAEAAGCLICKDIYEGITYFDYPIVGENGDVDAALAEIERYCMENELPLRFTTFPASVIGGLLSRYDGAILRKTDLYRDYCYRTEDIRSFAGKRYAGQRNHVRRFYRENPSAVFRRLTRKDMPALLAFANDFDAAFPKKTEDAAAERAAAFALLQGDFARWFCAGCIEIDGRIVGVALGEKCGKMLFEHIEKALSNEYAGVYPALFQGFVTMYGDGCETVNREDDAQSQGLRTSKMQYHPSHFTEKYDADIQNLFATLTEPPTVTTERLTLNAIQDTDADAYGRLCLDDERNRFWGYDYRKDLGNEIADGTYFCRVAREDFAERRCMCLAIRLHGDLIGEVVLHRFDWRGGCEIGARILPQYAGKGYGREALGALADWALYSLGITQLRARCFRENEASRRMLSAVMRPDGEDERMLYFRKTI